jgi:predicted dehydrogenase/acetyltransferase-like isoleucine patch superfamily enzyme
MDPNPIDLAREKAMKTGVRVAVIGCGGWGRNHVRSFAELGVLAAVVDPNEAAAAELAEKCGVQVAKLEEVLTDKLITAVVVAAPASLHYDIALRALEADKHVFVEKPLSLRLEDAKALCAVAERRKRTLMVGHLLQYHPVFLKLKEMVGSGELGQIQYIYSNRLNIGKLRREEDVMWSFAPHDISMVLSLIGDEPDDVQAIGSYHLHKSIADVTMMHMGFPNGSRAHVFVSWLHPFKEQKLVIVGSRAMAVFDDTESWGRKLMLYPHGVVWQGQIPVARKADGVAVEVVEQEPLKAECQHFIDCVTSGRRPRTDGNEGVRVLSVLTKASKSLQLQGAGGKAAVPQRRVVGEHPGVTIHETAYVDDGVTIGEGTKIWHFSHILGQVKIGRNCNIGQNVVIGPKVMVGDNVKIQNNVSVYEGVTLEDGVFCGPSCVFTNVNNPRSEVLRKSEYRPTRVRRGASIGANATVVCGHELGEYCFVAAGAVVAADVPAYALMVGVPARRVGWMSRAGAKLDDTLVCPLDGSRYRPNDLGGLELIEE